MNKTKIRNLLFIVCSLLSAGTVFAPAMAAENIFIKSDNTVQPIAAMCNTHEYDLGISTPAENLDATTQEQINQIVTLKANLITLEMKRQYDFLDATIKRLSTQLHKAMLASKLQAAGATTSSAGGGSGGANGAPGSINDSRGIAGMEDCFTGKTTIKDMLDCESRNVTKVSYEFSAKGVSSNIRFQLCTEYSNASSMDATNVAKTISVQRSSVGTEPIAISPTDCSTKLPVNQISIQDFLRKLNATLIAASQANAQANMQATAIAQMFGGK